MEREREIASLVAQTVKKLRPKFDSWVGKIPWRKKWQSTSVFLPEKSHGQSNLVSCSPWGHKELDRTEQLILVLSHIWPDLTLTFTVII